MKKSLILICIFAMVFVCSVPAFAANSEMQNQDSTIINEYEMLQNMKKTSVEELESLGYSKNEIEVIKEFSIEKALLERASLPEEELYCMGYEKNQVALLKSYDGAPIETRPEMKGVFADMNGTIKKVSQTNSSAEAQFNWEWTNSPLFSGTPITEAVSCGFLGVNTSNQECIVKANVKYCDVDYYRGNDVIPEAQDGDNPKVLDTKLYSQVTAKFPMGKVYLGQSYWAKKGALRVGVTEQAIVNKLHSTAFFFAYAHPKAPIDISEFIISLVKKDLAGIVASVKLSPEAEKMYSRGILIHRDGTTEHFEGL